MYPANMSGHDPEFIHRNTIREGRFHLIRRGFVGNGLHASVPQCDTCNSCVPLRINSAKFVPSNSQESLLMERRQRFSAFMEQPDRDGRSNHSHFQLFERYLRARHPNSAMRDIREEDFHRRANSLSHRLSVHDTHENHRRVALATVDILGKEANFDYLSYDPDYMKFSLGKYSWLSIIDYCMNNGIKHMYIGPWIAGSQTMDYKKNFSGLETFDGEEWVDFDPDIHLRGPVFPLFENGASYVAEHTFAKAPPPPPSEEDLDPRSLANIIKQGKTYG